MITVLRFKDFQGPFTSNSKLSRTYSIFKDFPGPGKMSIFFKDFQGPVATLFRNNGGLPSISIDHCNDLQSCLETVENHGKDMANL